MRKINIEQLNFEKGDGLLPAIIQDAKTHKVLMLGYMNKASIEHTLTTQKVTFYSRSKQRLWTKGETSGNFLHLIDIGMDCDQDALLIKVNPVGATCHTGDDTCFQEINQKEDFLAYLERIIQQRKTQPSTDSYTSRLFAKGINKIAQKVGEEAVEIVIEAKDDNQELFLNEAADLLFHYLVLLAAKEENLQKVIEVLESRHQ